MEKEMSREEANQEVERVMKQILDRVYAEREFLKLSVADQVLVMLKRKSLLECDSCGKKVFNLYPIVIRDKMMVCNKCLCQAESVGDMEYERQREERGE